MNRALLLLLLFCQYASGANYSLLFGGNCEEPPDDLVEEENKFLSEMTGLSNGFRKKGWEVNINFDGAHSRCTVEFLNCTAADKSNGSCCPKGIKLQSWSINKFKQPRDSIKLGSKHQLIETLNSIAKKTATGDNKILVSFNTHGTPSKDGRSHGVCLSDGSYMDIDDPELIQALKEIQVNSKNKLAIVDTSCFGGASTSILPEKLGENVCVISSQSATRPAQFNRGAGEKMIDRLNKGNDFSLSDIYSDLLLWNTSSLNRDDLHQPTLSSDASKEEANHIMNILGASPFDDGYEASCLPSQEFPVDFNINKVNLQLQWQEILKQVPSDLAAVLSTPKDLYSYLQTSTNVYNQDVEARKQIINDCNSLTQKVSETVVSLPIVPAQKLNAFNLSMSEFFAKNPSEKKSPNLGENLRVELTGYDVITLIKENKFHHRYYPGSFNVLIDNQILEENSVRANDVIQELKSLDELVASAARKYVDTLKPQVKAAWLKASEEEDQCGEKIDEINDKIEESGIVVNKAIALKRLLQYRARQAPQDPCLNFNI